MLTLMYILALEEYWEGGEKKEEEETTKYFIFETADLHVRN